MLLKWKSLPKLGDIKSSTEFAWFPKRLSDGRVVWLERIRVVYRYQVGVMHLYWAEVNVQRIRE